MERLTLAVMQVCFFFGLVENMIRDSPRVALAQYFPMVTVVFVLDPTPNPGTADYAAYHRDAVCHSP